MKYFFKNACNELNLDITEKQIEQFFIYKDLLIEWNKKINLTAILEEKDIILKHFIDCLTIAKFRNLDEKNIADIGTGAGFPGLVLKIYFENSNISLVDALNKRINFLKEASKEMNVKNVNFIHARAEDLGKEKNFRESFDFCVSRAVANLSVLAEYDLPFVKIGGEFIALKGPSVNEEIADAKNAIKILGGEIADIKTIKLPFSEIEHKLVFIQKLRQTPNQYPRKGTKISKNPIK